MQFTPLPYVMNNPSPECTYILYLYFFDFLSSVLEIRFIASLVLLSSWSTHYKFSLKNNKASISKIRSMLQLLYVLSLYIYTTSYSLPISATQYMEMNMSILIVPVVHNNTSSLINAVSTNHYKTICIFPPPYTTWVKLMTHLTHSPPTSRSTWNHQIINEQLVKQQDTFFWGKNNRHQPLFFTNGYAVPYVYIYLFIFTIVLYMCTN